MSRLFASVLIAVCFVLPFSAAHASNGELEGSPFQQIYCFFFSCDTQQDKEAMDQAWQDYNGATSSVPELDAAGAPIAAALIAGLLGLGIERRRRKNK